MHSSKNIVVIALAVLLIGSFNLTGNSDKPAEIKKYDNFSLYDFNNTLHSLNEFSDKEGIVLMFISTKCPVSNAYNSRMASLHQKFGEKFSFVGINSNKQENVAEIKKHSENNKLNFVILKDSSNVIADKFSASVTPEIYVLNNNLELLYQGRIDDSRKEDNVQELDLSNVLGEILEGKKISIAKTKAFGCSIKRK